MGRRSRRARERGPALPLRRARGGDPRSTACLRPSSSPTSPARRHGRPAWAIATGVTCGNSTTGRRVVSWPASGDARSRAWAMDFSRSSTARPVPCGAPRPSRLPSPGWDRSALGLAHRRGRAGRRRRRGYRLPSVRASVPWPRPVKCSSPRPSRTSWWARVSRSRIVVSTRSRASPTSGTSTRLRARPRRSSTRPNRSRSVQAQAYAPSPYRRLSASLRAARPVCHAATELK